VAEKFAVNTWLSVKLRVFVHFGHNVQEVLLKHMGFKKKTNSHLRMRFFPENS
jgi:hypothetical protein